MTERRGGGRWRGAVSPPCLLMADPVAGVGGNGMDQVGISWISSSRRMGSLHR